MLIMVAAVVGMLMMTTMTMVKMTMTIITLTRGRPHGRERKGTASDMHFHH